MSDLPKLLLVDDHTEFCFVFETMLKKMGLECDTAHTTAEALAFNKRESYDIIFLDVILPDGNGIDIIDTLLASSSRPEIIVLTASGDSLAAEKCIKLGAWDYIVKPINFDSLKFIIERCLAYRGSKRQIERETKLIRDKIIGSSPKLNNCLYMLNLASKNNGSVLITGETGTGKELFARALHDNSYRSKNKFIVVDCTNLPVTLAESLLFGHERGSFTGAQDTKEGLFKQANGGTIFLDEIGDLDMSVQKSLLRVLQEKKFRPLSSKQEHYSDFRLIAATNRDLAAMVRQESFRKDLYYRIKNMTIELPAMRERIEDLPALAQYYVNKLCREYNIYTKELSDEFMAALNSYPWPGNVRELVNVVHNSIHNAINEPRLFPDHLPQDFRAFLAKSNLEKESAVPRQTVAKGTPFPFLDDDEMPTFKEARKATISMLEQAYLHRLAQASDNNIKKACSLSKLSRTRLYELLQKHNISMKGK